ncbi:hypothetical protein [Amycolatopsis sp. lyj-108]|uniref:hypothetical protein n=1 Tax=Amycolatopsis sp. lyj-108 TaxID=2789286 RepID=UPI0039797F28
MPEQEMVPETRTTAAVVPLIAELNADAEVAVIGGAAPPPWVPPFWLAQPIGAACAEISALTPVVTTVVEVTMVKVRIERNRKGRKFITPPPCGR